MAWNEVEGRSEVREIDGNDDCEGSSLVDDIAFAKEVRDVVVQYGGKDMLVRVISPEWLD